MDPSGLAGCYVIRGQPTALGGLLPCWPYAFVDLTDSVGKLISELSIQRLSFAKLD